MAKLFRSAAYVTPKVQAFTVFRSGRGDALQLSRNDPDYVINVLRQVANTRGSNAPLLRSIRVILSDPPNQGWVCEFLDKQGHLAIFSVFKSEIVKLNKAVRIKGLSKDSETIAECCRCTRAILNTDAGIKKVVEIEQSLTWLAFSLRYVNIKTQYLVLTALAGICLVSPAGHYRIVAHYSMVTRCLVLKDVLRNYDPETTYGCFLLMNSIINQLDHVRHRNYMRQVFVNCCGLRKKITTKGYFGFPKLQTEILVFEEAEALDLRTDDDGNAPPFPGSPDGRVPDISETFGDPNQGDNYNSDGGNYDPIVDAPQGSTGDLKQQIAALKAQLKACEDEVKTLRALANGGVPMRPQKPEWMEAATAGGRPATPAPARPGAGPPGSKATQPEPPQLNRQSARIPAEGQVVATEDPAEVRPSRIAVFIPPVARCDDDDLVVATGGPPPPPGMMAHATGGPPPPPGLLLPPGMGGGPPPPPGMPGMGGPPPPPMMPGMPGMLAAGGPPPPPLVAAVPAKKKQTPGVKMKPLMWAKLGKVQGTVWEKIDDEHLFPILDLKDFEANFEAITKEVAPPPTKSKTEEVHLLPPKRTNHIQIVMKGMKLNPELVSEAISNLKYSHFPHATLEAIKSIVPTKEEDTLCRNYDGDFELLGSAEKFLMHMIRIPQIEDKMTAIVFKSGFRDKFDDLAYDVKVLSESADALKSDPTLPKFLEVLLAYGNYMNGTTPRGGIYGFKLNSLIKFGDTFSTSKPKMSLLHYILETIAQSRSPKLQNLLDFLPKLEIAHEAIMLPDVTERLKQLRYDLAVTEKVLKDPATEEQFLSLFGPFQEVASKEIKDIDDKLIEFNQKYAELLKLFSEPPSTPSYLFFETWSTFLVKISKCQEQNEKFKKEEEEKDKKAEAAKMKEMYKEAEEALGGEKFNPSPGPKPEQPQLTIRQGIKLEQGTLDFAISNLKSRGGFNQKVTATAIRKSAFKTKEPGSIERRSEMNGTNRAKTASEVKADSSAAPENEESNIMQRGGSYRVAGQHLNQSAGRGQSVAQRSSLEGAAGRGQGVGRGRGVPGSGPGLVQGQAGGRGANIQRQSPQQQQQVQRQASQQIQTPQNSNPFRAPSTTGASPSLSRPGAANPSLPTSQSFRNEAQAQQNLYSIDYTLPDYDQPQPPQPQPQQRPAQNDVNPTFDVLDNAYLAAQMDELDSLFT